MKFTLKTKLSLAISALVVVVLAGFAAVLIREKITELRQDIARAATNFAELSTAPIAKNFQLYGESGFARLREFTRETLDREPVIAGVSVISFDGEILYRSTDETPYAGEPRRVAGPAALDLVRGIETGFLDENGKKMTAAEILTRPVKFVFRPYLDEIQNHFLTLRFEVSYAPLRERIFLTIFQIAGLAVLGAALGIGLALWLSKQITRPISRLDAGAREISRGNLDLEIPAESGDEIGELAESFTKMAKDLKISQQKIAERERFAREVELATAIQQDLLPKNVPEIPGFEIAAALVPADEVAGDLYDFIPLADGKTLIIIGDVTGHGIAAGVVSTVTNALSTALAEDFSTNLEIFVEKINAALFKKTARKTFVTAIFAILDPAENTLEMVSLGHDPALWTDGKTVENLPEKRAPALGMLPKFPRGVAVFRQKLAPGEQIFLYTDGIPESWNNRNELFGPERLAESVQNSATVENAEAALSQILHNCESFRHGFPQKDDITAVLIRRGKS